MERNKLWITAEKCTDLKKIKKQERERKKETIEFQNDRLPPLDLSHLSPGFKARCPALRPPLVMDQWEDETLGRSCVACLKKKKMLQTLRLRT